MAQIMSMDHFSCRVAPHSSLIIFFLLLLNILNVDLIFPVGMLLLLDMKKVTSHNLSPLMFCQSNIMILRNSGRFLLK